MDPYGVAKCVLKVDVGCKACKMSILEVLGSVCGVYDVNIDADRGLVYVSGVVDPNHLLKAMARTGHHAKIKHFKLQHPHINSNRGYYNDFHYPLPYHAFNYPHPPMHSYGSVIDDPFRFAGPVDYPYPIRPNSSYYQDPGLLTLPPPRYYHACGLRPFAF